jgi:hypothetical protein
MALDSGKFVMEGPATVEFLTGITSKKTLTSINPENAKFTAQETVNEKARADDSLSFTQMGKEAILEASFDELDPADMDDLEAADNLIVDFANTGKRITMDADIVMVAVTDGKTVVTAKVSGAAGTTWSSLFTVGATP